MAYIAYEYSPNGPFRYTFGPRFEGIQAARCAVNDHFAKQGFAEVAFDLDADGHDAADMLIANTNRAIQFSIEWVSSKEVSGAEAASWLPNADKVSRRA